MSTPKTTGAPPKPSPPRPRRCYRPYLWGAYQQLLKHSTKPILVGPWRGEWGYEVLYWIPFLDALRHRLQIAPERLIPIAQGGMARLYRTPVGLELYAMRTPDEIRIENKIQQRATGELKQRHVTAWDRAVVRDAAKTLGLRSYLTLHPAWMYQTLNPFWTTHTGLAWAQQRLRYSIYDVPDLPEGMVLPPVFTAAKFYFRHTYPYHAQTRQFAIETIKKIASVQPVVLLNTGLHADEHFDVDVKQIPNVSMLKDLTTVTPQNGLILQAAVLARAQGYVGTYGGPVHLALLYRKPTVTFYTQWGGTTWANRHMSEALAVQMGIPFRVLQMQELPLLQQVVPTMELAVVSA